MKFKRIHFILNPVAGSEAPVLSYINKVFCDSGIDWDVSVTQKHKTAYSIAKKLTGKTDVVAIYGGDGSLSEVAAALCGTDTPMAIIPGGTANVIAKTLKIPSDPLAALELLAGNKFKIAATDMGMVNKHPFIIRVNLGIMADMILTADRELKNKLGQMAYGVTALKSLAGADPINFKLFIDGEKVNEKGVALTVTNFGGLGIGDFELLPDISIKDGLLDVILLNDNNLMSVLKVAGSTLVQKDSDVLKHWKCSEVLIIMDKVRGYICDDMERKGKRLSIKVLPDALKIVIPK